MSGRPRIMLVSNKEEITNLVSDLRLISRYDLFLVDPSPLAFEHAIASSPDLLVIDIGESRPEENQLLKNFKEDARTSSIPRIAILNNEANLPDNYLEDGASDYLVAPVRAWELLLRIKLHLRIKEYQDEIARKGRELEEYTDLLLEMNSRLEGVARKDELTRLWNRRAFNEQIDNIHNYSIRYQHAYCLVMADLDHFKEYNDMYGHQEGDRILEQVASALIRSCRSTDFVSRFGGEEFVIILPETDSIACKSISHRILNSIRSLNIMHENNEGIGIVTISLGTSEYTPQNNAGEKWEHVLRRADQALYVAKKAGRNRVCYN